MSTGSSRFETSSSVGMRGSGDWKSQRSDKAPIKGLKAPPTERLSSFALAIRLKTGSETSTGWIPAFSLIRQTSLPSSCLSIDEAKLLSVEKTGATASLSALL